nr:4-galactosyl-N-acetylglucosaminide 3-alpha-L-fucosyltransferase 9-like [Lytechinus pictus]
MDPVSKCLVTKLVVAVLSGIMFHVGLNVTQTFPSDITKPFEEKIGCRVHQGNESILEQDFIYRRDLIEPDLQRLSSGGFIHIYEVTKQYDSLQGLYIDGHYHANRHPQRKTLLQGPYFDYIRDNTTCHQLFLADKEMASSCRVPEEGAPSVDGKEEMDNDTELEAEETPKCIKRVHIFSGMEHTLTFPEMNHFRRFLQTSSKTDYESDIDCVAEGYDCDIVLTLGDRLHSIRGKDAVIFGMVPTIWKGHDMLHMISDITPDPSQTWIYFSTESPYRASRWAQPFDIASLKYHILMTYNREADIPIPFGYYREFDNTTATTDDTVMSDAFFGNRTGLLSWVATNCKEVYWPRVPFIQKILEEIPLDDYGACGHKQCLPRRSEACNRLFASYKFFLAIPNSECRDYITEKFWMISLLYGAVPLVLGAPKKDYEQVAPPNSFVHIGDFEDVKDLAEFLLKVDRDETLYRKFHDWRRRGEVVNTYPLRPGDLCRTIPHIHPREEGDIKYLGDSVWFTSCRTPLNNLTVNQDYTEMGYWTPWK